MLCQISTTKLREESIKLMCITSAKTTSNKYMIFNKMFLDEFSTIQQFWGPI